MKTYQRFWRYMTNDNIASPLVGHKSEQRSKSLSQSAFVGQMGVVNNVSASGRAFVLIRSASPFSRFGTRKVLAQAFDLLAQRSKANLCKRLTQPKTIDQSRRGLRFAQARIRNPYSGASKCPKRRNLTLRFLPAHQEPTLEVPALLLARKSIRQESSKLKFQLVLVPFSILYPHAHRRTNIAFPLMRRSLNLESFRMCWIRLVFATQPLRKVQIGKEIVYPKVSPNLCGQSALSPSYQWL